LYDSLLDELEDDVVSRPQEVEELGDKVADDEEADALLEHDVDGANLDDSDNDADIGAGERGAKGNASAEADNGEGDNEDALTEQIENWSDDPVRMYLTQMGEIPLLTRAQEIYLARQIETTRAQFRGKLLECEYVCLNAFKVLARVHRGELPFDRTVQVSVTDRLEKEQILGRLPHNLRTLEVLIKQNKADYRTALSKRAKMSDRRKAWGRLGPPPQAVRAANRGAWPPHPADRGDDPDAQWLRQSSQGTEDQDRRPQADQTASLRPAATGG